MIKNIVRVILGKRKAHYQTWLPYLAIAKNIDEQSGTISYKNSIVSSFVAWKDIQRDEFFDIHIIGSGPSIDQIKISKLKDGTSILLNGAISLIGSAIDNPLAVAIEDERFVFRHFHLIEAKIPTHTPCILSIPVIRALCECNPAWLNTRKIVLLEDIRKPYGMKARTSDELGALPFVRMDKEGNAGVSLDPDRGVFLGGSVVVSALQFAMSLNPRSIGLFGIDISNADQPRFYEKPGSTAKSGIARAENRIVSHLLLAKAHCEESGIRIINHSKNSALVRHGFGYSE